MCMRCLQGNENSPTAPSPTTTHLIACILAMSWRNPLHFSHSEYYSLVDFLRLPRSLHNMQLITAAETNLTPSPATSRPVAALPLSATTAITASSGCSPLWKWRNETSVTIYEVPPGVIHPAVGCLSTMPSLYTHYSYGHS